MEKVKVTLDGYNSSKKYQLFLRVNGENGITTSYTCKSSDEYTYNRKLPDPRPVETIEINGDKFNSYIAKGILSYDDFPEMKSSDAMWIAEGGMVVIHIKNKDFIIYDLLHVSDRTFESIQQPSEQKEYDEIDASFRHYVIDVVNGKPQPLMISDTMFYLNADKVDVKYADGTAEQLIRSNNVTIERYSQTALPLTYLVIMTRYLCLIKTELVKVKMPL